MKLSSLPLSDFPWMDVKQWMRFRNGDSAELLMESWRAFLQLFFQVNPLVEELPIGLFNRARTPSF